MTVKLNLIVPFGVNETPASFTSRLAANHRLPAREFCLDWNIHFQEVVDGRLEPIAKIAELGGISAETLTAHAFVRTERQSYTHREQRLVRPVLRRSRIHVCPACLIGDIQATPTIRPEVAPYNRSTWLIEAIKTCPVHRIALVEIATDRAPNSLHDFAFHVAPAVPHLDAMLETATRRDLSGLETYVLRRLEGATEGQFLDGLPLYVAIRACEMIGAVAVFGRRPNLSRLSDEDWRRASARGFEIAAGGAKAIGEFLTNLQNTYPYSRSGLEGPQALYGRVYQWLEFGADDPAYDPVRDVVGEHIRTHLPLGPGDTVFGNPVAVRTLHSIRTLSIEADLHPKRLRKVLMAVGAVCAAQAILPDQSVVFPSKTASDAVRQAKGSRSLRMAGQYLNAPRVHISLLAEHGFIKPHVAAREFCAADRYAVADLDRFLAALLDGARPVHKPKADQVSIPAAAKRACCSAAGIVRLILDRKLAWVGEAAGQRGYLSVLVDVDEIRVKTRGPDHGGLTQREVANLLQTNDGVVRALTAAKHLRTFTAKDPVNHCPMVLIRPEEAARFQREYVSLFMLAKENRKHFRRVLKELNEQGIEPAFNPHEIGARLYARSDITLYSGNET